MSLRLFLLLITICSAPSAFGQSEVEPFHTYRFAVAAGYFQPDDDTVEKRVLQNITVSGKVILIRCENTEDFDAGFRIALQAKEPQRNTYLGFTCNPETGDLIAGVRSGYEDGNGNWVVVDDQDFQKIGDRGKHLDLSLTIVGRNVNAKFGDHTFTRQLRYDPTEIYYYGFGATGTAEFYEIFGSMS